MQPVADFRDALVKRQKYGRWHKVDLHNHSPASIDYAGHFPTAAQELAGKPRTPAAGLARKEDYVRWVQSTDAHDLPCRPDRAYRKSGWSGWPDYLG